MKSKPVVVIGDGWAALASVGLLTTSGVDVLWITASGSRMVPPLACIEDTPGVWVLAELASKLKLECGVPEKGSFIREFRNKAFREPIWTKATTQKERDEIRIETLWAPEQKFAGGFDRRFDATLGEIEEEMRKILIPQNYSNLKRIDEIPITGFQIDQNEVKGVILGSGDLIETDQVIYADRWSLLPTLEGLPKPIHFLRKREPMGVLQVSFGHKKELAVGSLESFFSSLHRESGKEVERHVWGYFSTDGKRSQWTICLSPEEVEDNHEIAKKLRRLKGTLDKIFSIPNFLPQEVSNFSSTVIEDQYRFEEEAFFADSQTMTEPCTHHIISGIQFLCDGYGPSRAYQQVGAMLGIDLEAGKSNPEHENMNSLRTGTL